MSWFPTWSSILGAATVVATALALWRVRQIRRQFSDHRVARFVGWPLEDTGGPTRVYWLEGVTRTDVENALYGHTDARWGWLCRPPVRLVLVVANPLSWALTIYGTTNLPLSLQLDDSGLSYWGLLPIPLWLAVRRSVRLVADAPTELLDERLVALRDRTYVSAYRIIAMVFGSLAAVIIIMTGIIADLRDRDPYIGIGLLTGSAYATVWALAALPSVILAWTLRRERSAITDRA